MQTKFVSTKDWFEVMGSIASLLNKL